MVPMHPHRPRLDALLDTDEQALFRRLDSPAAVQDFLDDLPINFELEHETYMSPRRVIREKTAHCFEGALFAAAVLAYHGQRPLLLDLKTNENDEDHVVTLFRDGRYWGAISKTNHSILRWRDPVYLSVRELAMSFFNEYFLYETGEKTMESYSRPFDLSRYAPERWVTEESDLFWLVELLDVSPHESVRRDSHVRRGASLIERENIELTEWLIAGRRRKLRHRHARKRHKD